MAIVPEFLSPEKLGDILRDARDSVRLTQAAAASKLNIARTTLVAIEQGQRRPRIDELQQLAAIYGVSLNTLLRQASIKVDLLPRFRKLGEGDERKREATDFLNNLVQAEIELENLLGIKRPRIDPPERPLLPGNILAQAEQDAAELRQWLGIGMAPIHDIGSVIELQLGARLFIRRLPATISGLYAFDEQAGPCILLNASHPRERRAQTGAHEIGHLISTRRNVDLLSDNSPASSREERYANAFARCFLIPARAVAAKFQDVTLGSAKLTRRHIIVLSHSFGVSREAMVRRLEELGLTKEGTWEWFLTHGGITDEQAREVLGETQFSDPVQTDAKRQVSLRMSIMAGEAWRRGLLSEGQLSRLLHIDRIDTRVLIDEFEAEGDVTDDSPSLMS